MIRRDALAASVVTGLATGPRSFTGLAAVTFAAPPDARTQPDRVLGHPAAKTAIGLLALQEWVLDKLPQTPSRLEVLGLCTRALGAGAAGAVLARRSQTHEQPAETNPEGDGYGGVETAGRLNPPVNAEAPDWVAIAACAATSAAVALGVAVVGVHLRGGFERLFGRDWPAAALEDASSAGLAAAAVYVSNALSIP